MSVNTDDKSLAAVGFEHSRILRGFLAIVAGVLVIFAGLALYNILGATGAPAVIVELFALTYYVGILVAVGAPLWYWFGRPIYYINKHRA